MSDGRVATAAGRLARLGFEDAEGSADAFARLGPPASTLVVVTRLARPGWLVEIEAIAALDD